MIDIKLSLQKSKDIVLRNMEDYKIYLNKYINDSRVSFEALDYSKYLHDCMATIFYKSMHDALQTTWSEADPSTMISRIAEILDSIENSKEDLNLCTPAYACIAITNAASGQPLTTAQISALSYLDEKVKGYFSSTKSNLKAEFAAEQ